MTYHQPALWSHAAASHLLPGLPTPLTWSILGPAAERAERLRHRRLGYELPAKVPVWRLYRGRAYVNLAVLQEAESQLFAESGVGSMWGRHLLSRAGRPRPKEAWRQTTQEAPRHLAAVQQWAERVQAMQWRQATILQVMEELEPQAERVLLISQQLAAGLGYCRRQLTRRLAEWQPSLPAETLEDLTAGLDGRIGGADYRHALWQLVQAVGGHVRLAAAPGEQEGSDWMAHLPDGAFRQAVERFLEAYGHWAAQPLETASPRWREAPEHLLAYLAQEANNPSNLAPLNPDKAREQRSAAARQIEAQLGWRRRREFKKLFNQMQQLTDLLVASRNHLVMVMAAARRWALAAAEEGLTDGRLSTVNDVFLLEVEELKQMMTGEWSNPAQVQAIVEERRAQRAAWANEQPPEVIAENNAAESTA